MLIEARSMTINSVPGDRPNLIRYFSHHLQVFSERKTRETIVAVLMSYR